MKYLVIQVIEGEGQIGNPVTFVEDTSKRFGISMELPKNFATADISVLSEQYGNPAILQLQNEYRNRG